MTYVPLRPDGTVRHRPAAAVRLASGGAWTIRNGLCILAKNCEKLMRFRVKTDMAPRSSRAVTVVLILALAACSKSAADYVASGDAHAAGGRLREAVIEYRNAVQQDPRLGDVRLKLAKTFEQLGEGGNAAREYVRAADLLPENAEAQLKAGTFLLLGGQFEDARTRAEKALAADPKLTDAIILKANAMANLKDVDGAIREMEEALKVHPDEPRMRGSLGALELAKGNTADAEREFRRAIEIDPKNVNGHLALAEFLLRTKRPSDAEQALRAAHTLEPKNLLANRSLAVFYAVTNRAAEAEPYLKTIAAITTDGSGALALADYYLAMGRLADARQVIDGLSANDALFSETRRRLAAILYAEKKPAEAQKALDDLLAKTPTDADALLLRARLEQLERRPEDALRSAQAALKANPNLVAAHYLQGELHEAAGRVDEAIAAFQEVLRLNPGVAGAQLELARLNLAKTGGAAASVGYSEQVLARQAGNPMARLTLVRGLLLQGNVARAEREAQTLMTRFPNAPAVHAEMGNVMVAKRDLAAARGHYEKALSIDANQVDALAGLVTLDLAARRVDAAKARVTARLSERPDDPRLIELLARVAMAANDVAGAETELRRLIQIAPDRLSAYSLLAQTYVRQRRLDEARNELAVIAAKQKKPVGAETMIGMLYEQQGRAGEARKMYEQVLAYEPRAAVAANNLAWMMAEGGDNLDLALRYAQTAKSILPDQPEVSDTLAWVYYKKDLAALAVEPLQHAIAQDPKNAEYHYRLGLVYLKTGDAARAKQALEQALALNPAFRHADDARSRLGTL